MRTCLTTLLIAIAFMNVAAGVRAQNVTMKSSAITLEQAFGEIKKQTGYQFWYEDHLIARDQKIKVDLKDVPLKEALDVLLRDQPLEYSINEMTVVIRPKEKGLFQRLIDAIRSIKVFGKVIDENGQPLIGATIKVKGSTKQTTTNRNGEFMLENVQEDATIEVSYVGYLSQEVRAGNNLSITMQPNVNTLQEVSINKGYYRTSRQLNTGAVSSVSSEALSRQPVGDPLMALHGQVPGLYLAQESGIPGAAFTVRLRGQNSIANGNDPLYIIDGVPFSSEVANNLSTGGTLTSPFATIGMDNIESIDVLKDADATAIYGSRGANGVILITTKKGKAGRTNLSVNFNRGFGRVVNTYDMMNTQQYLEMRREAFANDNRTPAANSYDVNGTWDQNNYTDWEDLIIGGTSQLTNANATVSGGSELVQFLIGGAYRNETTVFPGDYRDRKLSVQASITNRSANGRFTSNLSVNFLNDNLLLPPTDITNFIIMPPDSPPIYNADGTLNWANSTWTNPFGSIKHFSSTSVSENMNAALNMGYKIIEGLSINLRAGYNSLRNETHNLLPLSGRNPANTVTANSRQHQYGDKLTKAWIVEPSLSYSQAFGKGKVDAVLGGSFQDSRYQTTRYTGSGYSSDALMNDFGAAGTIIFSPSTFGRYRYNAVFARVGYSYDERYVLNLTGRRDGSSRFGPGQQFGNFGAVGAAWIFSKEKFARSIPSLSYGKLRASYGTTGNDQLQDYQYLSTYSSSGITYQGIAGLNPQQHTNPSYGWETVKKLETALELGFFDNRLMANVSWYRNRTGNQLVGYPLPATTGFTTVQANLPAVVQNSGWELELSGRPLGKAKLDWSVSANLSIPKNKLVSYPDLAASSYSSRYIIGQPLFINMRYHLLGIDSQSGVYTFEDRNGDGSITSALDRYPVFVGQRFFGGLTNQFSYKGFELNLLLQFVKQQGYETALATVPGQYFTSQGNVPAALVDRWRNPGDNAKYQKYTQLAGSPAHSAYALFRESDGMIVDKSFVRLRNVSLSWTMPTTLSKRLGIASLKLYAQAQNLFTITGYKGVDPEISSLNIALPPLRMTTFGLQASIN